MSGEISCPKCGSHNVECVEKPHHDHRCHDCGHTMLPAPVVTARWSDEVVEAAAEAIYCADPCYSGTWANQPPEIQGYYRPMARAALAVVPPDPVIAEIREIVDAWLADDYNTLGRMQSIARLLADGAGT